MYTIPYTLTRVSAAGGSARLSLHESDTVRRERGARGVRLTYQRDKDGKSNFDDLTTPDANAPAQVLMFMPMALQEMVLAVWMIARGFRPGIRSTEPPVVVLEPGDRTA